MIIGRFNVTQLAFGFMLVVALQNFPRWVQASIEPVLPVAARPILWMAWYGLPQRGRRDGGMEG